MDKTWKQGLVVAGWVMLAGVPQAAHAALAELSWGGRFGSGSIVYDRDVSDALAADGKGSFMDSIVSFHVEGIKLPYGTGGILLEGTGGSILSLDIVTPCNYLQNCESSSVSFLLGRSHANDPLSYRLTLSLPFALDSTDQIPIDLPGLREGQWPSGIIRNEFNSPSGNFIAIDYGSSLTHRLLAVAAPVPEPATWLMFGLGVGLLGFTARRRS